MSGRTQKGIRNTAYALVVYAVNIVLQFISRKVFIDHLGTEILGLNTTATSLLSFLNLAELGIGTAVMCTLYAPLSKKDTTEVREILAVHGWLYRRVAFAVIALSAVLMVFFPLIFSKSELPLWYSFASFSVILFSSLLSYFVNFREVVLSADQAEYKIQYSYKLVMLLKICAQIAAVSLLPHGYIWWLVLEVVFAIAASAALNLTIDKSYPFLKELGPCDKELRHRHSDVIIKIKQVFVHKIGAFAVNQSIPLMVFACVNLTLVTIYGNYMIIVGGLGTVLFSIFNSLGAGVGNLIAEGDTDHTMAVYRELFGIRFFFVSFICFVLYYVAGPFVEVWVGPEFIIDNNSLILIILIFFLNQMRTVNDIFLYGYGMFQDVWAPILETAIDIFAGMILGHFFALPGILLGVLGGTFLIHFVWKPYFLFSKGFKRGVSIYLRMLLKYILVFAVVSLLSAVVMEFADIRLDSSWMGVISYIVVLSVSYAVFYLGFLLATDSPIRHFCKRIVCLGKSTTL